MHAFWSKMRRSRFTNRLLGRNLPPGSKGRKRTRSLPLEDRSGRLGTDPQFVVLWSQRSIAQLHICLAHGLRKPPHDTRLRLRRFGGRSTRGLESFTARSFAACSGWGPGSGARLQRMHDLPEVLGLPRPLNASWSDGGGPGQFRLGGDITSRSRRR